MCKHFQHLPRWALKMIMMKVRNLSLVCCQAPKLPPLPQFLTRGCAERLAISPISTCLFLRLIVDMVKTPLSTTFLVLVEHLVSFHVMDSIENMQGFMGFMGSLTATELKKTTSIPPDPPLNDHFCIMEPSQYKWSAQRMYPLDPNARWAGSNLSAKLPTRGKSNTLGSAGQRKVCFSFFCWIAISLSIYLTTLLSHYLKV